MSGVRAMQNTVDNFICGLVIKVHNCYSLLVKLSDSFMVLQAILDGSRTSSGLGAPCVQCTLQLPCG